jgi:hypothetical protein
MVEALEISPRRLRPFFGRKRVRKTRRCEGYAYTGIAFNSCRNRHCSKCQEPSASGRVRRADLPNSRDQTDSSVDIDRPGLP